MTKSNACTSFRWAAGPGPECLAARLVCIIDCVDCESERSRRKSFRFALIFDNYRGAHELFCANDFRGAFCRAAAKLIRFLYMRRGKGDGPRRVDIARIPFP